MLKFVDFQKLLTEAEILQIPHSELSVDFCLLSQAVLSSYRGFESFCSKIVRLEMQTSLSLSHYDLLVSLVFIFASLYY